MSDLAASTHIREEFIRALEALDQEALPAIGYTLGYVRTYAQALGLDGDVAVKDYKADVELTRLPLRDAPHVILRRQMRLPRGFVSALSVIGVTLMLGTWYGTQSEAVATPTAVPLTALEDFETVIPAAPVWVDGFYTLRTTSPSWVEVKDAAGNTLVSQIFVADQTWQGPADGGYTVSVRDAGAVELYNGASLVGTLGEAGEPIEGLTLSLDLPTSERP